MQKENIKERRMRGIEEMCTDKSNAIEKSQYNKNFEYATSRDVLAKKMGRKTRFEDDC